MNNRISFKAGIASATLAVALAAATMVCTAAPAQAQAAAKDAKVIILSIGHGQQVNLPVSISDVVITDPGVADVEVKSSRQIYVHAKGPGETNVYGTDRSGKNVYAVIVRVGANLDSLSEMLKMAMPESDIKVTTMNGVVLLTGSARDPEAADEAKKLVEAFVKGTVTVVSRIKTAMPMQINLQVRIAEVSHSLAKEIGTNFATRDKSNGVQFGVGRNPGFVNIRDFDTSAFPKLDASSQYGLPAGTISLPFDPKTGQFVTGGTQFDFSKVTAGNILTTAGKLFGLDIAAAFDLTDRAGLTTTLAQPNLTAVSGEPGHFLAGGSFPIPQSSGFGQTSVSYKDYGVGLDYTATVVEDGRIRIVLKTEVSDISSQGAVRLNGFEIPATTTRVAQTTIELGSGQSMMIGGLLSNQAGSSVDKIPGVGDVPILGALFKSNGWRRNNTELMIVITPYLVRPVSEDQIHLPTDGYDSPNDLERIFLNKTSSDKGNNRPIPTVAPNAPAGPDFGAVSEASPPLPKKPMAKTAQVSAPGFTFEK